MRKQLKSKLLQLINTLIEAIDEIDTLIEIKKEQGLYDLLVECQEAAISIGTAIDESEGKDTSVVNELTEFCEYVYRLSTGETKDTISMRHSLDNAKEHLLNMPVRKEIVFLPYKACMWDSMESIWKEAMDDTNCDVYVVPIPYFNMKKDRSLGEECYEGELYPDYVKVTDYKEYDFNERRPDTIIIHNPYDEYNYVTSVHPYFYAKNLRKYTEQLVYVPYFIFKEINIENATQLDELKPYCTVPGVLLADKIIVQSDNIREAYLKILKNLYGEEKVIKAGFEKKILGLGSPKLDKITSTSKDRQSIPKEWLDVIKDGNGQYKKVILYNTSITAFLKDSEGMIDKIKTVLDEFENNAQDCVLLWRPHPLIKQTMASMRPELMEEYQAIVDKYRASSWGIYDDTSDVDRAIAISDGYYGDRSSLVTLCQQVNKPVMIQMLGMKERDKHLKRNLAFYASAKKGNKMWVSALKFNGLFEIDLDTDVIEYKGRFQGYDIDAFGLHSCARICKDKLIFFPEMGKSVDIYDMTKGEFERLDIEPWADKNVEYTLAGIVERENEFVIVPRYRGLPVVKYSALDNKLQVIYSLPDSWKQIDNFAMDVRRNISENGNFVWSGIYNTNKVSRFDYRTGNEDIYTIEGTTQITTVAYYEGLLWIGEGKNILCWNEKTKKVEKKFEQIIDDNDGKNNQINQIICHNGYVYVLPHWLCDIKKIHIQTGNISVYNITGKVKKIYDIIGTWRDMKRGKIEGDKIVIDPVSLDSQIILDVNSNEVQYKKFVIKEEWIPAYKLNDSQRTDENFNLTEYIEQIKKKTDDYIIEGDAGKKIYEALNL